MHSHQSHHSHSDKSTNNRIKTAFFLNLFFSAIEFAGGLLTGSVAILADAIHDLGDALTLGLAWFLQNLSGKKPNDDFTYGLRRLSLLSALITGTILIIGSFFIIRSAYHNFLHPQTIHGWGMMALSFFGILINGYAAFTLSKGHTHNEKMLTWHMLEDLLGWAAILIGSILILIFKWYWIDSVLALLISLIILWNVFKNIYKTVLLFLQVSPADIDLQSIKNEMLKIEFIKDIHDIHFWSLDGERHILTLHVIVSDSLTDLVSIKSNIRKLLKKYGKIHSTIEIEKESEVCSENLLEHH